ncbi:hypothetical protein [Methylobacterium sp. WL116]|uniref:hypothetical protein n=1 Tax=Methylobacterium sp. WL116 TaxID=2603889 RepID=UPI0011C7DE1A|nr:hypothetical protein [Methylobacterium sp. WL116]TXM94669.1 hypothetical protein FV223_03740 [Methylobacterium sp. WL116]
MNGFAEAERRKLIDHLIKSEKILDFEPNIENSRKSPADEKAKEADYKKLFREFKDSDDEIGKLSTRHR